MATPAEEIEKAALGVSRLARMMAGAKQMRRVRWPGGDEECLLRVVSCAEVMECHADAYRHFKALGLPTSELWTAALLEDEVCTQLLFRACRDPEHPDQPFALDADDLRTHTSVGQRARMYEQYEVLAVEVDPVPGTLTPEEEEGIADALKKEDRGRLRRFGASALATSLLSMASRPSP